MEETSEIIETKTVAAEESPKHRVSKERWYGVLLVVVFHAKLKRSQAAKGER